MITKREKLQYVYVFLTDLAALAASVILAWLIVGGIMGQLLPYSVLDWVQALVLLVLAYTVTFFCFDQTENIVKRTRGQEAKLSIKSNLLMMVIYSAFLTLSKAVLQDSRYFLVGVVSFNLFLLPAAHGLLKNLLVKAPDSLQNETLVGIVTTGDHAGKMIREISNDWSRRVCGVALLEATGDAIGTRVENVEIKANYDTFMNWLRRAALDEVYIDVPMDSGESFIPYLEEMESMGLTVHFHMPLLDRIEESCCNETSSARLCRDLGRCAGGNLVTMATIEPKLRDQILKRLMDILGSLVGCIISIPIIAITAIPLKLESPGPLFFKQKRVGRNGRVFYIHKLRSMYMDAEERKKELMAQNEMNGLMFKMQDDPRITKVGKFIRKTSIDELPQFFDVLRGDMSLVGTRPPTLDEYKQYESHHKRRLSMKPGITGLWQVSGRSDIEDFEDVVKLDVEYIDNWSLLGVKLAQPVTTPESCKANFTNEGGVGYIRYLKNIMGLWIIQCVQKQLGISFAEMVELAKASTYTRIFDVNDARFSAPQDMSAEIRAALAETGAPPATDADLINCIYHSLAYCYGEAYREMEAVTGQHWDKLYIAGGGAKNATLNELTAHYTGKQVVALPIEATAIGNLKIQMNIH